MSSVKLWLIFFISLRFIDVGVCQACGSVLTGNGTIVSQGHPQSYPARHDCSWTIQANDYDTVHILFRDFHIEPDESCNFDSLEISAGGNSKKFCGEKVSDVGLNGRLQLRGSVTLRFESDDSINHRGFSLLYRVEPGEPPTTTPLPATTPATTPALTLTCDDEPCQNGGECTTIDESEFYCFCEEGYDGDVCEIDINECESDPCQNGGTCVDGANSWSCQCIEGYIGQSCSINVNDCLEHPCKNGATCEDKVNTFHCACVAGWTGWDCGTEIDECTPNPCQNQGACEDHLGYHTCVCHPEYTGENCTLPVDPDADPLEEEREPNVATTPSLIDETTVKESTTPMIEIEPPSPIMTTPASIYSPSEDPPGLEDATGPFEPELDQQNNLISTQRTVTTSQPEIATLKPNEPSTNATNQNDPSISDENSGIPLPVVIGVVGGLLSLAGAAAAVYRCFNSSSKPTKVQPVPEVVRNTGDYFEQ